MRDYGKVHVSFWSSPTIRAMSEDGRVLSLYLMTSPHTTIAGVFRLPDGYVCEDLGWTPERVRQGFAELFRNGFGNRCETTKWVWIYKHLEWNPPENPNQRKSAAKCAASIPDECTWKSDFMRVWAEPLGITWAPSPNPSPTVNEPFRNQKQEQEQEQEKETGKRVDAPQAAPTPRATRLPSDWELTAELEEIAVRARRDAALPPVNVKLEAQKFLDHWRSKSGKDATKLDWVGTWRNWIRNAHGTSVQASPQGGDGLFRRAS